MQIIKIKIADLIHDPANARKHDDKNLSAIKGSLAAFGQQKPIVIDEKNVVLAGNGTLEAAKALGWTEIGCVVTDLKTSTDKKAFALADNRTSELASWDTDILSDALKGLTLDDFDITSIGFDLPGLDTPPEGLTDPDDVPEDVDTRAKPGDIWILGNHRVMCGDSTNIQHVEKLMNGEKADMVFTDPPYGMFLDTNYDSMFSSDAKHNKTGNRFTNVVGDHEDFNPDFINNIFASFSDTKEIFLWGADYYSELIPERKQGSWVVWDKRCNEQMDKVTGNTFELCWSKSKHKRLIARLMWSGHHGMQKDDTKTRVHPTQKPSALAEWFFEQWGEKNDLVADVFLGSGSTLVACEKTNRKCYGMEIDPKYVDVILARWEKFTGKTAVLENNL